MLNTGNVLPVKIQPPLLRPMAYRVLSKKYGLNIKSDGLAALAYYVGNLFGMNWKKNPDTLQFLEQFALLWRQQERGLFIDEQGVKDVVSELKERERATVSASLQEESLKKTKNITIDSMLKGDVPSTASIKSSENEASVGKTSELMEYRAHENGADSEVVSDEEQLDWRNYFKVINASEQAKYSYDPVKLQFTFTPVKKSSLSEDFSSQLSSKIPDIDSNVSIFPNRFYLVRDRLLRNESFQNADEFNPLSSIAAMQQDLDNGVGQISGSMTITQIKNLLGRDGQNFLLLGLLSKNAKGGWSLEDPSGSIEIEISQAVPTQGLFYVPGCIVLAEGIYFTVGHKFHVSSMTHPPGERRENTLEAIGNLDLLGLHGQLSSNYVARLDKELKIRLHLLEKELTDHRCIILGGDIFLNELDTLEALKKVFIKMNDDPPTAVIMCGSFTAVPVHASMTSRNVSSTMQYQNIFDDLANLISEFENLAQNSTFILVPGVNDPWGSAVSMGSANTWPQQPIPSRFTHKMNRVCKNAIWASNPTRLAYLSQEIVVVSDCISERLKRYSISFPMEELKRESQLMEAKQSLGATSISQLVRENDQLPAKVRESRKLVKTILDQGHLSPFTTSIRPLVWNKDNALTLHPIPTALILCDTTSSYFDVTYNGCKAMNPGKFIVGKRARYLEYNLSSKKASLEELYF